MRVPVPALAACLGLPPSPPDAAGWLAGAAVALHPGGGLLAAAHGARVALVPLSPAPASSHGVPVVGAVVPDGDAVTALAFVAFAPPRARGGAASPPAPRARDGLLLVGTARGVVQVHGCTGGAPLTAQRVHAAAVSAFHVRAAGAGTDPLSPSDDVSVASADAVARLAGAELAALAALAAGGKAARAARAAAAPLPPLAAPRWELAPRGRADALVAGPRPPALRAALDGDTAPRVLVASAGGAPALATHDGAEAPPRGAFALVADLAAAAAARVLDVARTAVVGRDGGLRAAVRSVVAGVRGSSAGDGDPPSPSPSRPGSALSPARPPPPGAADDAPPLGDPAPVWRAALADGPRRATSLALAPTRGLAAAADALGRVTLLDLAAGTVVGLWKGYRGAQLAWLPRDAVPAAARPPPPTPPRRTGSAARKRKSPDPGRGGVDAPAPLPSCHACPLLAVYAPRRGAVEVWAPAPPPARRVAALPASGRGRLLVPPPLLGAGGRGAARDAWWLDCETGEAWSVVERVEQAL